MLNYQIRVGTIHDLPFLKKMLYEAVFWNPKKKRIPIDELFAEPEIAKILHQWGKRDGDYSLIAMNEQKNPVAAVWYRFWTPENHSYGYIDEDTPEIGIAVLQKYRGEGLGTMLMSRIMKYVKDIGIKQMSLSVDSNSFALSLYQKLGFRKVSDSGTSWTMVKTL